MITVSKVIVIGYSTAIPRSRLVQGGKSVVDLPLAVTHTYRLGEEWKEVPTYFDVTCFGAFAKAVQDLPKGTAIYCEGRLASETWVDKQTGKKRYKLKVIAERLRKVPPNSIQKQGDKKLETQSAT